LSVTLCSVWLSGQRRDASFPWQTLAAARGLILCRRTKVPNRRRSPRGPKSNLSARPRCNTTMPSMSGPRRISYQCDLDCRVSRLQSSPGVMWVELALTADACLPRLFSPLPGASARCRMVRNAPAHRKALILPLSLNLTMLLPPPDAPCQLITSRASASPSATSSTTARRSPLTLSSSCPTSQRISETP